MLTSLLRHRLKLWLRHSFRNKRRGLWQALFLLVVGGALVYFVFIGSSALFGQLMEANPLLVEPLLSLLFGALVLLALLSGFSLMLYELFLRSDLELLLAAPVSLRSLFGVKFIEGMAAVGAFSGLLGITALAGYAQAAGAWVGVTLTGVVVLAAILVMTTALAILAILFVTRVMPPRRVRGALAALGAVVGAGIWLGIQFATQSADNSSLSVTIGPLIESWRGAFWSPTTWAADALTSVQAGRWGTFALDFGLLGALNVGLVALSYGAFARTFYVGHGRVSEVGQRETPASDQLGPSRLSRWLGHLPPSMRAVAIKDWRTLRRDLRMLSQLIFPLVIVGFFTFSLATNDDIGEMTGELSPTALYWILLAPLVMMAWFVIGSLSIYAFGWEGKAFALLRIGPLRPTQVLVAKALTSFIPLLILFGALTVGIGIWWGVSPVQVVLGLLAMAWILAGMLSIVTVTAALTTRFDAEHPQKSVGFLGSLPPLIASAAFVLASTMVVLRVAGVAVPFLPDWSNMVLGLILTGVLVGIGLLGRIAVRRIEGWQLD